MEETSSLSIYLLYQYDGYFNSVLLDVTFLFPENKQIAEHANGVSLFLVSVLV